ncbi:MAG: PD40 domain-containing protein [Bacteroidetes Order II. Incertae sedis bacterium]|nr:PD40 domain-containing protein [Bacteroidetes Order II. bacterium]
MKYLWIPCLFVTALAGCSVVKWGSIPPYRLAYNVFVPDSTKDNYEVFAMEIDGSKKENLTRHPDVAWTYLAYGKRLFFISDRGTCRRCYFLYEMSSDGQNVKKISDLRLEDSWMSSRKSGQELVVSGRIERDIRMQLFIINTETGAYRQITTDTTAMYRDPLFSPDGKQLVFAYKKNRRDRNTHEELFIMNEDGSDMRQLTTFPANDLSAKSYGYKAGPPRWHPTEGFISYHSKQNGKNTLFAVTPNGKKHWKLTNYTGSEGWHDWSADGRWLVFDTSNADETQYDIVLMNWKTKETRQLTHAEYKTQLSPVFVRR